MGDNGTLCSHCGTIVGSDRRAERAEASLAALNEHIDALEKDAEQYQRDHDTLSASLGTAIALLRDACQMLDEIDCDPKTNLLLSMESRISAFLKDDGPYRAFLAGVDQ